MRNWTETLIPKLCAQLRSRVFDRIRYITSWRTLRTAVDGQDNIIQLLHNWQGPVAQNKDFRRRFDKIKSLFRTLLGQKIIELVPQEDAKTVNVSEDGRYLSIDSLGDGIQHLLMLAYPLAVDPEAILLIEEPESELHPELQRTFMKVMKEYSTGQSFITTHSSVLLDSGMATGVYRVEHNDVSSLVIPCKTSEEMYRILDVLDVRASDLLQSNIVIWVEGMTDRMFLLKCLELYQDEFVPELHFQIIPYGGDLRAHFDFHRDESELVNVFKVSRHVAMMCDRDRGNNEDPINDSKLRLQEACEGVGGMYWVTAGREIENYLSNDLLSRTFRELLDEHSIDVELDQYEELDDVVGKFGDSHECPGWIVNYGDNKVRVMSEILKRMEKKDLDQYDLREKLGELVKKIREANPTV